MTKIAWTALVASALGFTLSRAYPTAVSALAPIPFDYFMATAMWLTDLGFLLGAVGLLVTRPKDETGARAAWAAVGAVTVAILTFVIPT